MSQKKLLDVKNLHQIFNAGTKKEVRAVDDISFHIFEGETFGLVGESGSGKSTTGRSIIRLYQPTSGEILFDDQDIRLLKKKEAIKDFRQKVQMIFQDPAASLNPRMKVRDIIAEGIDAFGLVKGKTTKETLENREARVKELLTVVGLDPSHASRYPHEFSGGQRQRIGIARALAVKPKFIIADEPISALDVSIQAQVVNLLKELQKKEKLTYLFIAHDLSMVKYISDRIGVMYMGKLVEVGTADNIYNYGVHPYTESLLSAIPLPDPDYEKKRVRQVYKPLADGKERALNEIAPGHFVYSTQEEIKQYQAAFLEKQKK